MPKAPRIPFEQIVARYLESQSIRKTAEHFGLSSNAVCNALRRLGIRTKPFRPWVPCRIPMEEVIALYKTGLGTGRIAALFHVSAESIRSRLIQAGIERHPVGASARHLNPSWNGGRTVDKHGYILIHRPEHPHANTGGYVREHRLTMETVLGRYLSPTEVVHHKDGDPRNNDPANLEVFPDNGLHLQQELTGKIPKWTSEGKANIRAAQAIRSRQSGH